MAVDVLRLSGRGNVGSGYKFVVAMALKVPMGSDRKEKCAKWDVSIMSMFRALCLSDSIA